MVFHVILPDLVLVYKAMQIGMMLDKQKLDGLAGGEPALELRAKMSTKREINGFLELNSSVQFFNFFLEITLSFFFSILHKIPSVCCLSPLVQNLLIFC